MEHPYQPLFDRLDDLGRRLDKAIEGSLNEHGLSKFEFVRIEEAAGILGVAIPTVRAYTAKKKLRHYKRGHYVYYKIGDLNEFIEKGRIEPKKAFS
ncbi:MAG: helix-turn-helix domain-containing protein [Dyadobacter sp.]|uniref:helix-turn-helix domain-containing protein n=1 Tax=Dyadobacter sp. TaxID=1914288 RepID=UPI001B0E04C1|nr:helix-turn-helix domain-containing protein [Dyadobacter sp.]MBO9612519.1 helix-turn-helix domain-containing protein [Dyadobacter sp.]